MDFEAFTCTLQAAKDAINEVAKNLPCLGADDTKKLDELIENYAALVTECGEYAGRWKEHFSLVVIPLEEKNEELVAIWVRRKYKDTDMLCLEVMYSQLDSIWQKFRPTLQIALALSMKLDTYKGKQEAQKVGLLVGGVMAVIGVVILATTAWTGVGATVGGAVAGVGVMLMLDGARRATTSWHQAKALEIQVNHAKEELGQMGEDMNKLLGLVEDQKTEVAILLFSQKDAIEKAGATVLDKTKTEIKGVEDHPEQKVNLETVQKCINSFRALAKCTREICVARPQQQKRDCCCMMS